MIFSQTDNDSLSINSDLHSENLIRSGFSKLLQVSTFNSIANYNITFYGVTAGISEKFTSTVTGTERNIRDDHRLKLFAEYELMHNLKFGTRLQNNIYSDDRRIEINDVSETNQIVYSTYNFEDNIKVTPYAGYSQNIQINEQDEGFIYGSEFLIDNYTFQNFNMNSIFRFQNEDISPRKNTMRYANISLQSKMDQSFANNLYASYAQNKKDFYFQADSQTASTFNIRNNIQSRNENIYAISDRFTISPENSDFRFDVGANMQWREIKRNYSYKILRQSTSTLYDNRIEEFNVGFDAVAGYRTDNFSTIMRISYSEAEEKYFADKPAGLFDYIFDDIKKLENKKNNSSGNINLSLTVNYALSQKDIFSFSLLQRKFQYDTPSEENYDDRDELISLGRILYIRKLSPYLNIFISSEIGVNTLVYLFSQRSSNNNVKRLIKLSSGSTFKNSFIQNSASAEVSANYTVYKYEDLIQTVKSFSFRQFNVKDSALVKINRNFNFQAAGSVKLSEQGNFNWNDFSSKPSRYIQEIYLEPKLFYQWENFSFGMGFRRFSRSTFGYVTADEKKLLTEYVSYGPVSDIYYNIFNRVSIKFTGWLEFIKSESDSRRKVSNFNLDVTWRI